MTCPNGSTPVLSRGPCAQLVGVQHCPCSDGRARRVYSIGQPDTYFSAPGKVRVRGKTVTGFVTCDESGYKFIANKFGKNGHLLP